MAAHDRDRRSKAHGIGAVIMAAGAGRRMGNVPKSLLLRDGEPLLLRQIRLVREAGAGTVVVVVGHHAERLAKVLDAFRLTSGPQTDPPYLRRVANPDPDRGTASSLCCGLAALPADLATWLVLLGDQPLLEAVDVRAVLDAWNARAAGIDLVVPQHAGQPGHPVAFGREVRDAVVHAYGAQGVREWRRAHPQAVALLPVAHARCTTDVDTMSDVERLRAASGVDLALP